MKFQNLYIDLTEEVVYNFFLFIALVAILFNRAKQFEQSPKEHSCIFFLNSMNWLRKRSHLKVFLFLGSILFFYFWL